MNDLDTLVPDDCFRSSNIDEMQRKLSSEYREHKVSTKRVCPPMTGLFYSLPLDGLSINFLKYGAEVYIDAGDFETFYMLEFPISGQVDLQLGAQSHRANSKCGSVVSPGCYVRSTWSEDCMQLMVKIEKAALESYLQGLILRDATDPVVFEPALRFETGVGKALYEQIVFLMKQATVEDGLITSQGYRKEVSRSILAAILDKLPHSYSEIVREEANRILPGHVLRAYRYIQTNYYENIANEDLAEVSRVSLRTLYAGFHKFLGMSPQSYLRLRRLEMAKRSLEDVNNQAQVSEIAANCGFSHMGRFSADFRRRYGQSPSEIKRFNKG